MTGKKKEETTIVTPIKKLKDGASKKEATLAVLNNVSLSTTEKVDKLLEIKQEDKEFKDTGERIPGSRKESAATCAVYKHEDKIYMDALSREFDKYKLDNETKRRLLESAREKYGYEVGVLRLIKKGDKLRNSDNQKETIKQYILALRLMKEYREKHRADADDQWCKKAIFMTCNGMGIAYAKWGKIMDAIENFQDAIENVPDEESRKIAKSNLEKFKEAYEKKLANDNKTKKCATLNVAQNKELREMPEHSDKWESVKSEIEKTDKKIDEEVYKLYGLTDEEIKIIEDNYK